MSAISRWATVLAVSAVFWTGCASAPDEAPASDVGQGSSPGELKSDQARITNPLVLDADKASLVDANGDFAFELYQAVSADYENLFFSPHSISLALAMTYAGAAGDTAAEMAQALRFDLPAESLHPAFNWLDWELASRDQLGAGQEGFVLRVVNRIWGQSGFSFEAPFLDTLAEDYGAGLYLMDFMADPEAARQAINTWVEEQTGARIKDLLPQGVIDDATRMVLTNAIYFLAPWAQQFDSALTTSQDFHTLAGPTVTVDMMRDGHMVLPNAAGVGYQAAELPYDGGQLAMLVMLPDAGTFAEFDSSLTGQKVREIVASLQPSELDLSFPKFELETSLPLVPAMQALGMSAAFEPAQADFSKMNSDASLYLTAILHKAFVKVDEEGTEAAAATAVVVGVTGMPVPAPKLVVDRPFVFVIRDIPTGAVLFVGRVVDPTL